MAGYGKVNKYSQDRFFKSELGLRIVSAVVMVVITLALTWFGGLPFTVFAAVLSALLYYEWQAMVRITPFDATEAALTLGFAAFLIACIAGYVAYGLVGFVILGLLLELSSDGDEKSDVRWIGLGALYCAIPAVTLPIIREHSFAAVILVMLVVWVTDVAAYFAGRQFGGPKLLPQVSPKKTWSGALGGLLGAVFVGIAFKYYVMGYDGVAIWFFCALLSVASQVGDLFESWVKRLFNVKDSSGLIPGHGGFLDRLDGLVAATVPVALVVALSL